MSNFLVETKNEYTTHLNNIITPFIFEGLQSIYREAMQLAGTNDILKRFQTFLKRVPKWNQTMIEEETNRIINSSHSYGWINDLIKATLKANLIVLMYNPTSKVQTKVNPGFYQDIKTTEFIHKIYIECARELYNNPYLLYHNYPPIEIKRNQRDCMNIIKDCIKEAIRKLLPVKHILQIYLGESMEPDKMNNQFERVISDVEEKNLKNLIHKDLSNEKSLDSPPKELIFKESPKQTNTEEKTIGSKILGIINNSPVKINRTESPHNIEMSDSSPLNTAMMSSVKPPMPTNFQQREPQGPQQKATLDDKLKNILSKDLNVNDSDMETSISYSQEKDKNNYQEIFSNSATGQNAPVAPKNDSLDKKKFFNKYLQF
jgi:hypothetical protein